MNGLAVNTPMVATWLFNEKDMLCAGRVLDRRVEEHVPLLRRSRDDVTGMRP